MQAAIRLGKRENLTIYKRGSCQNFGLGTSFRPLDRTICRIMSDPLSAPFNCPNCGAKYEIVRVEAPQPTTTDREITCVSCGGPLHGRQDVFVLKYFLVERPTRRA